MRFHRSRRVRYRNNPLVQVVAQVRFSPVLKLLNESPAAFQEAVIEEFPMLQMTETLAVSFSPIVGGPSEHSRTVSAYLFSTADGRYSVEVKAESLTLTTTQYEGWEEFWGRYERVFSAFVALYPVTQISRIGLRYVDIIDRESNGLADIPWRELICPELLGPMSDQQITSQDVIAAQALYVLALDDGAALSLRGGFGLKQDNLALGALNSPRQVFVIDSDFHAPREGHELAISSDIAGLRSRFGDFNVNAGGLFEWAAKEKLRAVLGPELVT